jgi:hypothetical protein
VGVVSTGLLPQAVKLNSIDRVSSSAKNFFISDFVLSFFGRTVYNNSAYLDFGIGVGNAPVWCQPYRGIFCLYYTDNPLSVEAPWGDIICTVLNYFS